MQCYQQKRQWHCIRYRDFFQSPKAEMFRKRTGNGVSAENVLTRRLSKSSLFYAVRSVKPT